MAPRIPGQRFAGGEDFSSQLGAITSDEAEGNDDQGDDAPADTGSSLLVVPEPPDILVPPPGSTAAAFRQVSHSLARP